MSFESKVERSEKGSASKIALAALVALAPSFGSAEGGSRSEVIEQERLAIEENLRSGELQIQIPDYQRIEFFDDEGIDKTEQFRNFTDTLTGAIQSATELQTSFMHVGALYHAEKDGRVIEKSEPHFAQLLSELAELRADTLVVTEAFSRLSDNGQITLEMCEKYGLQECIDALTAYQEWTQATALTQLMLDIANERVGSGAQNQ